MKRKDSFLPCALGGWLARIVFLLIHNIPLSTMEVPFKTFRPLGLTAEKKTLIRSLVIIDKNS